MIIFFFAYFERIFNNAYFSDKPFRYFLCYVWYEQSFLKKEYTISDTQGPFAVCFHKMKSFRKKKIRFASVFIRLGVGSIWCIESLNLLWITRCLIRVCINMSACMYVHRSMFLSESMELVFSMEGGCFNSKTYDNEVRFVVSLVYDPNFRFPHPLVCFPCNMVGTGID